MFILRKDKGKYLKPSILTITLLIMAFSPLKTIPMIACVIFWAIYWPFSTKWSLALRLIIAFILITCFQQVLGIIAWMVHVPLTVPVIVAAELLVTYFLYQRKRGKIDKVKLFDPDDYISLFVTGITIATLGVFILHAGPTLSTLIRFNATAIDDSAHLSLILADYSNEGYIYGPYSAVQDKIPSQQIVSYPQGWHLSSSFWWHSVSENLNNSSMSEIGNALVLFTLSRLVWYAAVVFLVTRSILYLANLATPKLKEGGTFLRGAVITVLVGFVQVVWMLELLQNGFSSFLPQIAYTIVIIFFAGELFRKNAKQDSINVFLISTALLTAGMCLTWLLAAPIGIGALLLGVSLRFRELSYKDIIKKLLSRRHFWVFIISILIIMCGLVQVIIQLLYPSGSNSLNNPGGIFPINYLLLFTFSLISIAYVFYLRNDTILRSVLTTTIVTPVLLTGLVYCYQMYSVGSPSYYSIKLSWLIFLVLFIVGGAALLNISHLAAKQLKALPTILLMGTFLLFLVYCFQLPLNSLSYLKYKWSISTVVAEDITKVFSENINNLPDNTSVIVAGGYLSEDVTSSGILNTLHRGVTKGCYITNPDYPTTSTSTSVARGSKVFVLDPYIMCDTNRNYIVIAGGNYTSLFNKYKDEDRIQLIK